MRHDFKPPLLHTSPTFLRASSKRKPLKKLKEWLPPSSQMYRFPPYRSAVKCAIGCRQNMTIRRRLQNSNTLQPSPKRPVNLRRNSPRLNSALFLFALQQLLNAVRVFGASTGGTLDDFASLHFVAPLKVRGCTRRRTCYGALPTEASTTDHRGHPHQQWSISAHAASHVCALTSASKSMTSCTSGRASKKAVSKWSQCTFTADTRTNSRTDRPMWRPMRPP